MGILQNAISEIFRSYFAVLGLQLKLLVGALKLTYFFLSVLSEFRFCRCLISPFTHFSSQSGIFFLEIVDFCAEAELWMA
jgi:hypothetical protein